MSDTPSKSALRMWSAHRRVQLLALAVTASACTAEPDTATVTEEVRVCADGPTVEGIDVSKWQGTIDWDAVAADGIRFAFIRTTDGTGYLDET